MSATYREGGEFLRGDNIKTDESRYFSLSDGSEWQIIPTVETTGFVEKTAYIYGLSRGGTGKGRRLFVVPEDDAGIPSQCVGRHEEWRYQATSIMKFWFHEAGRDVVCQVTDEDDYVALILQISTLLYPIVDQLVSQGGLPVHAGVLARDGKCLIIPAAGNIGKSTCCRRMPPPWISPADDLAMVVRCPDEKYRLHPLPTWSRMIIDRQEKPGSIQRSFELSGMFFLEQADTDEVLTLGGGEAAGKLLSSASDGLMAYKRYGPEIVKPLKALLFKNACNISRAVPSYRLRATLTGQFWEGMERELKIYGK